MYITILFTFLAFNCSAMNYNNGNAQHNNNMNYAAQQHNQHHHPTFVIHNHIHNNQHSSTINNNITVAPTQPDVEQFISSLEQLEKKVIGNYKKLTEIAQDLAHPTAQSNEIFTELQKLSGLMTNIRTQITTLKEQVAHQHLQRVIPNEVIVIEDDPIIPQHANQGPLRQHVPSTVGQLKFHNYDIHRLKKAMEIPQEFYKPTTTPAQQSMMGIFKLAEAQPQAQPSNAVTPTIPGAQPMQDPTNVQFRHNALQRHQINFAHAPLQVQPTPPPAVVQTPPRHAAFSIENLGAEQHNDSQQVQPNKGSLKFILN